MPNWCNNYVTVSHSDRSMMEKFVSAAENESIAQTFFPQPEDIGDNWYDWRVSNWGTKWDFGIEDIQNEDMNTVYGFADTAWAPPIGVFTALEQQGFVVRAMWHEGGMCFAGEYENGSTIGYTNIEHTEEGLQCLPSYIVETFNLLDYVESDDE